MNLQAQDCMLEIGGQAFGVTHITRGTVRFQPGPASLPLGRTTGRLNFGSGVWFAVSGTVSDTGQGQATLRAVRVLPADAGQEAPFCLQRSRPQAPEGEPAALRCL